MLEHFEKRIEWHSRTYEPISESTFPHVQMLNLGQRIVVNNVHGYLQNRVVFFLMNIHNRDRTIYFARAGEALIEHLYKADAELSSLGVDYAQRLADFVTQLRSAETHGDKDLTLSQSHAVSWLDDGVSRTLPLEHSRHERPLHVWCSTRNRSVLTAEPMRAQGYKVVEMTRLCEMNPGVIDGMSKEEIHRRFPDSIADQEKEPYTFRFPRAESYHDLAIRLEPVIFELERSQEDVLIIGQSTVLRCLIAYLQGNRPREIPFLQVREGDLVEIRPQAFGVSSRVYSFWDPEKERELRDIEFATRAALVIAQHQDQDEELDYESPDSPKLEEPIHIRGESTAPTS